MKRFRVKLVGFGLAVLAGSAVATDDWQPAASPNVPVSPGALDPIWLPAAPAKPAAVIPAQLPAIGPASQPLPNPAPELPVGPRAGSLPPSSLPDIPPLPPETPVASPAPETWRSQPTGITQQPIDPPRPVEQPRPMPRPTPPPDMLPRPRPIDEPPRPPVPPVAELPVAPPELMFPAGAVVPGKHGSFGSQPIRLGRDYPSLADLCPGLFTDGGEQTVVDRGFVEAEYLLWWMSGLDIPILATTNPDPNRFGFLGEPGTVSLLGPGTFLGSVRQGVRVRGGFWFDPCGTCGIDGSIFALGRRTAEATFTSGQFPVITRPVFSPNPRPNQPGVVVGQVGEAVTVPGILQGSLTVQADSFLWGADANLKKCLFRNCNSWATWFVGYRNLNLIESLTVTENINVIGPGGNRVLLTDPPGSVIVVRDRFGTENRFNGGQIGATWERRWGGFSLDARASVALGVTSQELSIFGAQTRTRPGQLPMTYSGGLLAAGPNLGTFTRNRFSVVPEITLNLGYWVTPNFKAYIGYNFLYWSNVIRPGEQIDPVVDLSFVPNAPPVAFSGQYRPQPLFRQSDLWVTGVQFGLEWRW